MLLQVMPGWRRASQNWRRSAILANLAPRPVLQPPPPPQQRHHPAPLPVFLTPTPTNGGVLPRHPPTVRSSRVGLVRASRGAVHPSAEGPAVGDQLRPMLGDFASTSSEGAMATPRRPMGRPRQRSRSMTSPSALLEEYKMRWTCKVTFPLKS